MARNRFKKIMRLLHSTDNSNASDEVKLDNVWKIRPWLNLLQENFLTVETEEPNSIDEIMVSFPERCQIKLYLPAKPNLLGHQALGMCWFIWIFVPVWRLSRTSKGTLQIRSGWRRHPEDVPGPSGTQRLRSGGWQLFHLSWPGCWAFKASLGLVLKSFYSLVYVENICGWNAQPIKYDMLHVMYKYCRKKITVDLVALSKHL